MKAKTIYEALSDVLKPKTEDEITKAIPPNQMKFVEECYELVSSSDKYDIVSDLGFMSGMFGFQFETKLPMTKEESIYHTGEIGEFTLGFIAEENDVYIVFDNAGSDYHLEDIEDLKHYLGIEHEGLVESIQDVLKPKSKEEIKQYFENQYPEFVKIFKAMFPNEEYDLDAGEYSVSAHFGFTEKDQAGEDVTFMISQHPHLDHPQISVLKKTSNTPGLGGFFTNNRGVHNINDVQRYVNNLISGYSIYR